MITLLNSCLTPKKAEKKLQKIESKYPQLVENLVKKSFQEKSRDTVTNVEYDFIEVLCEDKIINNTDTIESVDTIIRKVKQKVEYKTKTVTIKYEDTAKISSLKDEISEMERELIQYYEKCEAFEKEAKSHKSFPYLLGLLALLVLLYYLVTRKKK